MKLQYIISFVFLITIISCDCYVEVKGQIVSSSTGKPIENTQVTLIDKNREVYSDQNGNFLIDMQTGFCFDPEIQVSKKGFKPFQVLISGDSQSKNFKITSESRFVDFDEPLYSDSCNRKTFITGTWIEKYSQDFKSQNNSLIIYLDTDNLKEEIKGLKEKRKNGGEQRQ